jgi:hypothetical protein
VNHTPWPPPEDEPLEAVFSVTIGGELVEFEWSRS